MAPFMFVCLVFPTGGTQPAWPGVTLLRNNDLRSHCNNALSTWGGVKNIFGMSVYSKEYKFLILLFIGFVVTFATDYVSAELRPLTGPLSIPRMIHEWIWSSGGMILTGEKRRTRRKTCPSAILFTTNPTWTVLGATPVLRVEKPATWHGRYDCLPFPVPWRRIGELEVKIHASLRICVSAPFIIGHWPLSQFDVHDFFANWLYRRFQATGCHNTDMFFSTFTLRFLNTEALIRQLDET
jgi:hypothetical protein